MTTIHGYREQDLVQNRTSLLLWGGRDEDRRAWAEEAARAFPAEGPLRELSTAEALKAPLGTRGVVFVPDVIALGIEGQAALVRTLAQEEKPKLVLGLPAPAMDAVSRGLLRDDLAYKLQHARVDLSSSELKDAIRARRQQRAAREKEERLKAEKLAAKQQGKAKAKASVKKPAKSSAKPARAAASRGSMRVKAKAARPAPSKARRR